MKEKHWAMCNHCDQGYETQSDSEGLCVSCFVKGHRGRTCDAYCKVQSNEPDARIAQALAYIYDRRQP